MEGNTIKKLGFRSLFSGLLPLFVLAHFGHHLLTALPIPLLPMIRSDFALDYTQSGLVIAAFSLSYGIGQLPAGWLADRIGPRILITIGICGVALAGLLVGLSQTYIMMIVFLGLMGILGGGYHPASSPVISASVEPKNRGRALGFHMIGGSASFFLAPLIAAAIAITWGWRGSFIALAVPTAVFGIVFYVLLGRRLVTKKAEHRITSSHSDAPPTPGRLRRLVSFIILSTFTQAVMFSTISFIPLFLVDHFGISKETAAALIALVFSAGLWAGPLGGYLSDRLGEVPVILAVCFITGPIIYLLNLMPYGWGIGALLVTIGMILYVRMPVSEAYIISHTSERHRSTILGIYYFSAMEGGGILTPVMGYLIDQFGFYPSFTIAGAALLAVTLVCSIWLWGSRD
ncbi:Multidrug resistance protein MdtG [subsurface metagenome]